MVRNSRLKTPMKQERLRSCRSRPFLVPNALVRLCLVVHAKKLIPFLCPSFSLFSHLCLCLVGFRILFGFPFVLLADDVLHFIPTEGPFSVLKI